jgi:hypothetical protein
MENEKVLLTEFLERIEGKNINELMPILMEFKDRLPKDKVFTQEEKEEIFEAAVKNLPENEKNKYKSMLKMFRVM